MGRVDDSACGCARGGWGSGGGEAFSTAGLAAGAGSACETACVKAALQPEDTDLAILGVMRRNAQGGGDQPGVVYGGPKEGPYYDRAKLACVCHDFRHSDKVSAMLRGSGKGSLA
nr:hypothetical protein [Paracoccus sp. (in: a-proteobacteria)]